MEQSEHRCFLAKFAILCECGVWCPKTIKNSNIKDCDHFKCNISNSFVIIMRINQDMTQKHEVTNTVEKKVSVGHLHAGYPQH